MKKRAMLIGLFCFVTWTWTALAAFGQEGLVQVRQDFSKDPGWEFKNNRIEAQDPPTVKQDFGWSATNRSGGGAEGAGKAGERPAKIAAKVAASAAEGGKAKHDVPGFCGFTRLRGAPLNGR